MTNTNKPIDEEIKDIGFWGEVWQQIRLVFYLIKDREVPIYLKALPFLGVAYMLFPIDIITDFVPVLGQLDDLTLLLIGAKVFIEMSPPQVVARYMDQMKAARTATIIEGEVSDAADDPLAQVPKGIKLIEGELSEAASPVEEGDPAVKKSWFRR